jgi:hypothetical protein
MNTKIRSALCGLAIAMSCVIVGRFLWAGDDSKGVKVPVSGHVLILENGRTLEGDIEREGSQYRVRRAIGETWVSGDKVIHLCDSLEDAYVYLRKQANLRDPDERMRLARWCQQHDLQDQALSEVTAAVELRPRNVEYRRLLESLQRTSAEKTEEREPKAENRSTKGNPLLDPRSSILDPSRPIDLTAGSVNQFITKVQPILMNTCAGCHGAAHAGPFQLQRVLDGGAVSRRTTQYNLAHVLAQINPETISASPLLTRAVSIHGESPQPPIKNREAAAYRRLEDWVKQTLENNPQLRERHGEDRGSKIEEGGSAEGNGRTERPTSVFEAPSSPNSVTVPPLSPSAPKQPTEFAGAPPASAKPTMPADPFDPIIFNRQAHPDKP